MSLLKKFSVFSLVITTVLWSVGASFAPVKAAGNYDAGSLLALEGATDAAVYYIGSDGAKYVFPDSKTYFTWYENFDNVVRVDVAELDLYENGGTVTYRAGTKLVTTPDTANVYALEPGGFLRLIPDADTAAAVYGDGWGAMIQDVIPGYFLSSYTTGSDLDTTFPTGTLVQLGEDVYYVDGSTTRLFTEADVFEANNFDWDNIIIVEDLDDYTDGETITGEETDLSGYMPSEGGDDVVVEGDLTVALASDTPASTTVVGGAARVPFTKINLVNGSDTDVIVDSLVAERTGLGQDGAFSSLDLLDADTMLPLNNSSKTLGSVHTATFNDDFTVEANSTRSVIIAANMATLSDYAGETPVLTLNAITLEEGELSASLPINGNAMTLNGTVTIGTATVVAGGNNPSASTKEVGTTDYIVSSVKVTAGSAEDITIDRIIFTNNGSADAEDVENIDLINSNTGEVLETIESIDSDSIDFNNLDITVDKGQNTTFDLRLDIINGSGSTISYDVDKQADITVTGDTYGYQLLPTYTGVSSEPYYNASNTTIGDGTTRVESVAVAPSNVTEGLSGVTLGKFKFVTKGEEMNVTSIGWNFILTTTSASADYTDITNVTVYDENGDTVAGPKDFTTAVYTDGSSIVKATATTTDTITFPVGEAIYTVKGDLSTDFTANDTIQAGIEVLGATVKGDITGNTITPTPAGNTQSTSLTVKSASLTVTVGTSPAAQTVVAGQDDFVVATYILDGSTSGDAVEVTSIKPKLTTSADAYPNQISTWELWDGTTELTIGAESTTCSGSNCNTAGGSSTTTLTLANDALIVSAGGSKTITVKVNIGTGATSGDFAVGLQGGGLTAVDTDAQTVTPSITGANGQTMTLATGGTLLVALDAEPSDTVVAGNTSDIASFILEAKYEGIDINYLGFTVQDPDGGIVGGADEVTTLYLYEEGGTDALGSVAITGANATITPSGMSLDINEEKTYEIKALFSDLNGSSPAESGAGLKFLLSNIDVTGSSPGSSSVTVSGTGTAFNSFSMFKSLPTVTQIDIDGGDVITGNDTFNLKKFSVSSDTSPVGLFKFTFGVSTTTVSLTDTGYYLYESDSEGDMGDLVSQGGDVTVIHNDGAQSAVVEVYFDKDNDSAAGVGEHLYFTGTKYYTLRGTVTGHDGTADNESISTVFAGDNAFANTSAENAASIDGDAADDFIWSDLNFDLYSTTTATTTIGWFNGYRLPGIEDTSSTGDVITD